MIKFNEKLKILLFVRDNCEQSQKVYNFFNNENFEVFTYVSKTMGEKLPEKVFNLNPDFLISFRSLFIIPQRLIETVNFYSINFHPGPPKYPGSGSVNLALYNDESDFGVTAHLINEFIDNGKIIKTNFFKIEKDDNVEKLLLKTHSQMYDLFKDIGEKLFSNPKKYIEEQLDINKSICWNGTANKISRINKLQKLESNISHHELEKRLRSIHTKEYPLYIEINEHKFYIVA
jgi:methionyl-tRNA formyltransferase